MVGVRLLPLPQHLIHLSSQFAAPKPNLPILGSYDFLPLFFQKKVCRNLQIQPPRANTETLRPLRMATFDERAREPYLQLRNPWRRPGTGRGDSENYRSALFDPVRSGGCIRFLWRGAPARTRTTNGRRRSPSGRWPHVAQLPDGCRYRTRGGAVPEPGGLHRRQ
jgi:hypothetical protein